MRLRVPFMDAQAEMRGNDPDLPVIRQDARGNGPARLPFLIRDVGNCRRLGERPAAQQHLAIVAVLGDDRSASTLWSPTAFASRAKGSSVLPRESTSCSATTSGDQWRMMEQTPSISKLRIEVEDAVNVPRHDAKVAVTSFAPPSRSPGTARQGRTRSRLRPPAPAAAHSSTRHSWRGPRSAHRAQP